MDRQTMENSSTQEEANDSLNVITIEDEVMVNQSSQINCETDGQTIETSISQNANNSQVESVDVVNGDVMVKTPNSYKYPLLTQYYTFGPWIGRNRKAICLRCRLQTSSSQPDRLLKHLNKCPKLSEAEKIAVQDLMNERTANKRRKPGHLRSRTGELLANKNEYYGDEKQVDDDGNPLPIPPGGLKRLRRSDTDRISQIDETLTRWIMMCRIPLKTVHSQEFRDLVKILDPDYVIPSRETITNVLIPGMLDII